MQELIVKGVCLILLVGLGYLLKRIGIFKTEDSKILSKLIINMSLPAALINSFRTFTFDSSFLSLILIAVITNSVVFCLSQVISKKRTPVEKALYGLNMSSYNIGTFVLPFAQTFLPTQALIGVSMFDAGNCPFNSGLDYALVAPRKKGEKIQLRFIVDKLLHSVPFMTFVVLISMSVLKLHFPDPVYSLTAIAGGANAFLAMAMIGIAFEPKFSKEDTKDVITILGVRYLCGIVMAILIWLMPLPLVIRQVSLLILIAPVPSIAMVYSEKCGCRSQCYGTINSLSIVISLVLTMFALPLMQ